MGGAGAKAAPFQSHFGKGLGGRLTDDRWLQQRTSEVGFGAPRNPEDQGEARVWSQDIGSTVLGLQLASGSLGEP